MGDFNKKGIFKPYVYWIKDSERLFYRKRRKIRMKYKIFTTLALAGSALAELFGGWDMALETLLILMAADWITGGILLPAVFGKSPKSPNGALESRAGWKGLCRKGMTRSADFCQPRA